MGLIWFQYACYELGVEVNDSGDARGFMLQSDARMDSLRDLVGQSGLVWTNQIQQQAER
jgi:hypothetical protein